MEAIPDFAALHPGYGLPRSFSEIYQSIRRQCACLSLIQQFQDRVELYRLYQVMIEAGGEGGVLVPLLAPAGLGDEQGALEGRVTAQGARDFVAADVRQANVQENGIGKK